MVVQSEAFVYRVGKYDLLRLVSVQRQIVCPCPRLDVVYLGRPRVDVAGWDDEVGVVGELAQLVAGSYHLQITRVDHICRRSDTGALDNAGSDGLQRRRLTLAMCQLNC